jgi:hypothetical protein
MPNISPSYGPFFSSSPKAWLAGIGLEKHLFFLQDIPYEPSTGG